MTHFQKIWWIKGLYTPDLNYNIILHSLEFIMGSIYVQGNHFCVYTQSFNKLLHKSIPNKSPTNCKKLAL